MVEETGADRTTRSNGDRWLYILMFAAQVIVYSWILSNVPLYKDGGGVVEVVKRFCGLTVNGLEGQITVITAGWLGGAYWLIIPVVGLGVTLASIPTIAVYLHGEGCPAAKTFLLWLFVVLALELILAWCAIKFILLPQAHLFFIIILLAVLSIFEWRAARSADLSERVGPKLEAVLRKFDRPALIFFGLLWLPVMVMPETINSHFHLIPATVGSGETPSIGVHEIGASSDLVIAGFTGFHLALSTWFVWCEAKDGI